MWQLELQHYSWPLLLNTELREAAVSCVVWSLVLLTTFPCRKRLQPMLAS